MVADAVVGGDEGKAPTFGGLKVRPFDGWPAVALVFFFAFDVRVHGSLRGVVECKNHIMVREN
jgi:hypothetical protein